jgi:hypothetical protein
MESLLFGFGWFGIEEFGESGASRPAVEAEFALRMLY